MFLKQHVVEEELIQARRMTGLCLMCHTSPIKQFKRANLSSFHDWAGPVLGAHCRCLVSFRGWSVMVLWEWASKVTQLMKFSLLKWTLNYTGEFGQQNEEFHLLTTVAKPRSPKSSIVPTNNRFQTINRTISRLFCLNESIKIQLNRGSLSELNTQGHYYNLWVLKVPAFLFREHQHTREPPQRGSVKTHVEKSVRCYLNPPDTQPDNYFQVFRKQHRNSSRTSGKNPFNHSTFFSFQCNIIQRCSLCPVPSWWYVCLNLQRNPRQKLFQLPKCSFQFLIWRTYPLGSLSLQRPSSCYFPVNVLLSAKTSQSTIFWRFGGFSPS